MSIKMKNKQIYELFRIICKIIEMEQVKALLFQHWTLYKRSWLVSLLEILFPILAITSILIFRRTNPATQFGEQSFLKTLNQKNSYARNITISNRLLKSCTGDGVVALAPSTDPYITRIASMIASQTIKLFESEESMENYIRAEEYALSPKICYAIIIVDSGNNFRYKIRGVQKESFFNFNDDSDGPSPNLKNILDEPLNLDLYNRSVDRGMVGINQLINKAILNGKSGSNANYFTLAISPMYQQSFVIDDTYKDMSAFSILIFLLPLLFTFLRQSLNMLSEKEAGFRQTMIVMGLEFKSYYFAWFLRQFAVYFVTHSICSIILAVELSQVPFYIPFFSFLFFDIVLIFQNFLTQLFFKKVKTGIAASLIIFLGQSSIFALFSVLATNPTVGQNSAVSIIPHCAFVLALKNVLYAQSYSIDVNSVMVFNNYAIGVAILSFFINTAILLFLFWYFIQISAGEWGKKQHPLFLFRKCRDRLTKKEGSPVDAGMKQEANQRMKTLKWKEEVVQISSATKKINDKVILNELNMSIQSDEILVLIGTNGSGKTTLLSLLSGVETPTTGKITILGQASSQINKKMIGFCPQKEALIENLTVEEHIKLFAMLKASQSFPIQPEVDRLIRDTHFEEKRNKPIRYLSGGQKRKLSVALAFTGESKIILLDEATSGMDPLAKKDVWEMLKNYKRNHVVVLTTNSMEEAEFLGDQIGILSKGTLVCRGDSSALHKRYRIGYKIDFVKENQYVPSTQIIEVVQRHLGMVKIYKNIGLDISLLLQAEDDQLFPKLFQELDDKKKILRYNGYSISASSLEEVFMKATEPDYETEIYQDQIVQIDDFKLLTNSQNDLELQKEVNSEEIIPDLTKKNETIMGLTFIKQEQTVAESDIEASNSSRFFIHFKAVFMKRLIMIRRDPHSIIFEWVLPLAFIILALGIIKVDFIPDDKTKTINSNAFLSDQNPVVIPVGFDGNSSYVAGKNFLESTYGARAGLKFQYYNSTVNAFDQSLSQLKKQNEALKGGLYLGYLPTSVMASPTYYSLVNTRIPTSYFFLPTLGAEILINSITNLNMTITVDYHPLPKSFIEKDVNNSIGGNIICILLSIGFAFKFCSILSLMVKERSDQSKALQLLNGMNPIAYWTANLCFDYFTYLICVLIFAIIASTLNSSYFVRLNSFSSYCMLLIFFGLAMTNLTYLLSFVFSSQGVAQIVLFILVMGTGGLLPIIIFVFKVSGTFQSTSVTIAWQLSWVLRLLPTYSFGQGVINVSSVMLLTYIENCCKVFEIFAKDQLKLVIAQILFLVAESIIFFLFLLLIEIKLISTSCTLRPQTRIQQKECKDVDVNKENQRVNELHEKDEAVVIRRLTKIYPEGKKSINAVDQFSLGAAKGEIVGLLGVNGAGKTTTLQVLTGEIAPTSGDVFILGNNLKQRKQQARKCLGYCPQFESFADRLTVYENLELFYNIRSLKTEKRSTTLEKMIKVMDLGESRDILYKNLTSGDRRKLAVSVALVGSPKVILLDEPTKGMDPRSKKVIWKAVLNISKRKQSTIILTTHSMEQAESLSTKIAIMNAGSLRSIGTPQHIKAHFGDGYEISLRIQQVAKLQIFEWLEFKKIEPDQLIKTEQLEDFCNTLEVDSKIRKQISKEGAGYYIYNLLQKNGSITAFEMTFYAENQNRLQKIANSFSDQIGNFITLEQLQGFLRLKVSEVVRLARIFAFFLKNKEQLKIRQYKIEPATITNIFNQIAKKDESFT